MDDPTFLPVRKSGKVKISVCMATYNGAQHLQSQIASILKQLNALDQLIIVDDQSTDNTVDIIRNFKDSRIQLIINTFNMGAALTFDRALHQAEGDLIFLSDQDDFWYDDKVSALVDMFLSQNLDLIVHDAVVMRDGTVVHASLFKMVNSAPGVMKNTISNTFTGCCMAFRREILREILPISAHIGIFHDAWIGVLAEYFGYEIAFLHKPLMNFNRHGQNASTMKRRKIIPIIRDRVAFIVALAIQIFQVYVKRVTG
jgi:glycosyltransferase involved in cell wall biosynthesis